MLFDLSHLDVTRASRLMTALVTPRPIAWVVSQDANGNRNAAPFSFFNIMSSFPPVLAIGMQPRNGGGEKDSLCNIRQTREFVVSLVSEALASQMSLTSAELPSGEDELTRFGIGVDASAFIAPPRIAGSPAAFECRLRQIVDLENGRAIILGDIAAAHVDDDAVIDGEAGKIDAVRLRLIARMHGRSCYVRSTDLFDLARSGQAVLEV